MKVRHGFVSNSSSSSFQCVVCGTVESGYDAGLSDVGMLRCENGHTFCEDHVKTNIVELTVQQKRQKLLEEGWIESEELESAEDYQIEEWYDEFFEEGSEVSTDSCPICSMSAADPEDILKYMFITHNTSQEKVLMEIRANFKTYADFAKYLKGEKL